MRNSDCLHSHRHVRCCRWHRPGSPDVRRRRAASRREAPKHISGNCSWSASSRSWRSSRSRGWRVIPDGRFLEVKNALEELAPPLNTDFLTRLGQEDTADAVSELQDLPELSIFQTMDHGQLLRTAGQSRNALQYEIGNPLTASSMTRHKVAASLYAPLRVVLYETPDGATVFEYDLPSSQPSLSDTVLNALMARRTLLLTGAAESLRLVGCSACSG
jgi:uncharacterized protein (DUF302 family)